MEEDNVLLDSIFKSIIYFIDRYILYFIVNREEVINLNFHHCKRDENKLNMSHVRYGLVTEML